MLITDRDHGERLSDDDMATARGEEFLARSLAEVARKADALQPSHPGTCSNCGEDLPPPLVYCDEDCRSDHEARLAASRRNGRGGVA